MHWNCEHTGKYTHLSTQIPQITFPYMPIYGYIYARNECIYAMNWNFHQGGWASREKWAESKLQAKQNHTLKKLGGRLNGLTQLYLPVNNFPTSSSRTRRFDSSLWEHVLQILHRPKQTDPGRHIEWGFSKPSFPLLAPLPPIPLSRCINEPRNSSDLKWEHIAH